jgi:hypothetical protein
VAKNEEFRFKGREIIAQREEEVKVEKEKQVKELEEAEPVLPSSLASVPVSSCSSCRQVSLHKNKNYKILDSEMFSVHHSLSVPSQLSPSFLSLSLRPSSPSPLPLCPSGSIDDKGAVGIGIGRNEGRREVTMIIHSVPTTRSIVPA